MNEPLYAPTASSSRAFGQAGCLAAWLQAFLRNEGRNIPFADGLLLAPRRYHGPERWSLSALSRCCGPEPDMAFRVDANAFERRVRALMETLACGQWDMPPLIVHRDADGRLTLNDGNHRLEALRRLGVQEAWVLVWETADDPGEGVAPS